MKNTMKKFTVMAVAGAIGLAAYAGTQYTGESAAVRVDQTEGTRIAAATETIVYSPEWVECTGTPKVTVLIEGETLVSEATSAGTYSWTPTKAGTYTLTHQIKDGSDVKDTQTAEFEVKVPPEPILTEVIDVPEHTTVAVYTNGFLSSQTAGAAGVWNAWSNETATVVYKAEDGYYFENGQTEITNELDTMKNPATVAGAAPAQPDKPSLLLGVVAQRYPWNGQIDVGYWAKNTPNEGYKITVTVTLPDGTAASETYDCKSGKNTVAFDAHAKFGEVQFTSGVKVKATLSGAE